MALISCKNCGGRISDKASKCPKCGAPTQGLPKEDGETSLIEDNQEKEVTKIIDSKTPAQTPRDNNIVEVEKEDAPHIPDFPGHRRSSDKRYLFVSIILLVCAGLGLIYHNYKEKEEKVKKETKVATREHDPQESTNAPIIELSQNKPFPHDSIYNEIRLRFGANLLVSELKTEYRGNNEWKYREVQDDWEESLLRLGFSKQSEVVIETDCNVYNEELYDVYEIPFERTYNGSSITVSPIYRYDKRDQDGSDIPFQDRIKTFTNSFGMKFSSQADFDYFIQTLSGMGYVSTKDEDGVEYYKESESSVCPHFVFWLGNDLRISCSWYEDC